MDSKKKKKTCKHHGNKNNLSTTNNLCSDLEYLIGTNITVFVVDGEGDRQPVYGALTGINCEEPGAYIEVNTGGTLRKILMTNIIEVDINLP